MGKSELPTGEAKRQSWWRGSGKTRRAAAATAPRRATASEAATSRIETAPTITAPATATTTARDPKQCRASPLRHLFCCTSGDSVKAAVGVDADDLDNMVPAKRVSLSLLSLSSVTLVASTLSMASSSPPRVSLPQGTYEGRVLTVGQGSGGRTPLPKPLDAFLGVPYAQTTGGANRFRAPVPLEGPPGDAVVYDATRFGPRCAGAGGRGDIPEGEDCLNVNVYVPRSSSSPAARLPVVVYVHGGGFNSGCGAERDMASFVGYADADIVGVSFNYRVGALGFLGWWDAADPSDADAPLNLGLLDQQALFAWVQVNIGFFGGDAGNVTIMGLSAGAHSIGHHLQHYGPGQAPFHRAILESGGPTARAVFAPDHPRPYAQLRDFLRRAGVPVGVTGPDAIAILRRLPLATVVRASRAVWDASQASVCWPFQPVVDGALGALPFVSASSAPYIARSPIDSWRLHNHARVPVLTGFDSHEGTMFVPRDAAHADTDAHFRAFFSTLIPGLTPADIELLCQLYPAPTPDTDTDTDTGVQLPPGVAGRQWPRIQSAYAHFAYICPVLQTGEFLGVEAAADPAAPPVYLYEFAAHATALHAANHGDNAPVVAHDMGILAGHPGLLAVADAMHGAWVRFAVSGNPNAPETAKDTPTWEPYHENRRIMVFGQGNDERVPPAQRRGGPTAQPGTPAAPRNLSASEREQCRFWWDRVELSEGYGRRTEGLVSRL